MVSPCFSRCVVEPPWVCGRVGVACDLTTFLFANSCMFFCFSRPIHYRRPTSSSSLPFVTMINHCHIASSSSPPHYGTHLAFFYRERASALSSLVDSRRIAPTHPLGALGSWCLARNQKLRTCGENQACHINATGSSIRGSPLEHRGDRLSCTFM